MCSRLFLSSEFELVCRLNEASGARISSALCCRILPAYTRTHLCTTRNLCLTNTSLFCKQGASLSVSADKQCPIQALVMLLRAPEQVDPRCFPRGLWQDAVLSEAEVNPGPAGSRGGLATTKPTCWRLSGDVTWCRLTASVQSTVLVPMGLRRRGPRWLPRSLEVARTRHAPDRRAELSLRVVCRAVLCWDVHLFEAFPFEFMYTQTWQQSTRRNLHLPTLFYCRFCLSAHLSASVLGFGFSVFAPDGLRLAYFNNRSWVFVLLLCHFLSIWHWLTSR